MPELPEVETTCRGIAPHVSQRRVVKVIVRQPKLRWPVPESISIQWPGQTITKVSRRAKYILLHSGSGGSLIHLGMSGSLRVLSEPRAVGKHDHVDILLDNDWILRYTDPRRFGAVLWSDDAFEKHPLLNALGPEPLGADFDGEHLFRASKGRSLAVKNLIMNGAVVVGVGNIYASESLFLAGIDPRRAANRISLKRYVRLAKAIRDVLAAAIKAGGTTLKDFVGSDGKPGYFTQSLRVYDRLGLPCTQCGKSICRETIGQRASYFCNHCQR